MPATGDHAEGLGVGAAAAAGGVSVCALQFYDRIGLLPVGRDRAGRHRYTRADLSRLQRIRLLTASGVALAEIRRVLDNGTEQEPHALCAAQIAWCEQQELALRAQRTVLESVTCVLRRHPGIAVPGVALTALMNVEDTLMRYAALPDTDAPVASTVSGRSSVGHFASAEGKDRFLAAYDTAMAELPVPRRTLDVRTGYGIVRLYRFTGAQDDQPPLVLLPGRAAASPMWVDNLPGLLEVRSVYTVDLLGEPGMSEHPAEPARDIAAHVARAG